MQAVARFRSRAPLSDKRSSRRPHEPRHRASADPTAHTPAVHEGRELGAEGERMVEEADASATASSSSAAATRQPEGGTSSSSSAAADVASSSSAAATRPPERDDEEPRRVRGPDLAPRERTTHRDAGTGPENSHTWTDFDIGRIVRVFRTNREGAILMTLRKLHVRWWHASAHTMHKFLNRVGVSDRVLKLIPQVVDTCKVCRTWQKPTHASSATVSLRYF